MRPRYMTAMRCALCATMARSCAMISTAMPSSRHSVRSSSMIPARTETSSMDAGLVGRGQLRLHRQASPRSGWLPLAPGQLVQGDRVGERARGRFSSTRASTWSPFRCGSTCCRCRGCAAAPRSPGGPGSAGSATRTGPDFGSQLHLLAQPPELPGVEVGDVLAAERDRAPPPARSGAARSARWWSSRSQTRRQVQEHFPAPERKGHIVDRVHDVGVGAAAGHRVDEAPRRPVLGDQAVHREQRGVECRPWLRSWVHLRRMSPGTWWLRWQAAIRFSPTVLSAGVWAPHRSNAQ